MYSTYTTLLDNGWRMQDIDDMDMLGFLKIRAWSANKKRNPKGTAPLKKDAEGNNFIDDVWPFLSP